MQLASTSSAPPQTVFPGPPRRRVLVSERAEARTHIARLTGTRLTVVDAGPEPWQLALDHLSAGDLTVTQAQLPDRLTVRVTRRDQVAMVTVLEGRLELDRHGLVQRFDRGEVLLVAHPGSAELCRASRGRLHRVGLPVALLDEVARSDPDRALPRWRFIAARPSSAGARRWRSVARFIDGLLSDPAAGASPLMLASAARLAAATILTAIPNTALRPATSTDRRDGHADTLRRAIAFIEANPDLDITLGDIARAARVSTRAVQFAFRRKLDTTPTAYLRQVRLEHAHRQLRGAAPGDGVTVSQIALDWGFANASRFAAHYRAAYGQLPRETLNS
jgi:AraC-like DNA-binding protein